jgi:hypothetical protein
MVKKILLVGTCFIALVILVSTLQGQGSKKTITLPSGEVVWDLNGEWDAFIENYGSWYRFDSYSDIFKITQQGSSFVATRTKGDPSLRDQPGSEAVRGDLRKRGFKKVQIISYVGPLDSKGKISVDGNEIVIDDGEKARITLTRK